MFNKPREETNIRHSILFDISKDMTYRIRYPNRKQFTTIPKLGKQMNAGKVPSYKGSLNFTNNIDASEESNALKFKFVNKQATESEIDSQPLSTVNKGGLFQKERLKVDTKNSYNKKEIAYWYKLKYRKELPEKMRREEMVEEFEAQLKGKKA